ncbi:MAG: FMN-binding negative transcriptional regulator [Rhodobacteraceae bacterium]|nr:FMN-binding negative transcriptional regulator [Paracoccaceae bacterium]
MHPNPAFRQTPQAEALIFARARGFGVLTIAAPGEAPLAAHIPFVLDADGEVAGFHLVRSNPIARALTGGESSQALLVVSGPDAYVSPDWYGLGPDQVPTWNYVAVHLRGTMRLLDPSNLRAHLDEASAMFEARLAPKPPWRVDKMSPDFYDRLARQIIPAELTVEQVDATWKLNQNKPVEARGLAAEAISEARVGSAASIEIARMMRRSLDEG